MSELIETKFEKMGARLKLNKARADLQLGVPVRIDVRHDERGEFFDVRVRKDVDLDVIDVRPRDRHLLLMAREPRDARGNAALSKFLCGHDERAWFVAAVPEVRGVRNVETAMEALKPQVVRDAIDRASVPRNKRNRRRNAAFVRQGEWFFLPAPELKVDPARVLRDEPIRRGAGKPHRCQFLHRSGGERVRVHWQYPNGLTEAQFRALPQEKRTLPGWRAMVRDAMVYVRGAIRHPDHATIWLKDWHRVVMNTETQSRAMRHVAFLD